MAVRSGSRQSWAICVAGMIAAGILSRLVHTGWVLIDKYLGDALYAAMVYGLWRLVAGPVTSAVAGSLVMIALELFQLTGIPADLFRSGSLAVRVIARLMGTEFSLLDLAAYAVGMSGIHLADRLQAHHPAAADP